MKTLQLFLFVYLLRSMQLIFICHADHIRTNGAHQTFIYIYDFAFSVSAKWERITKWYCLENELELRKFQSLIVTVNNCRLYYTLSLEQKQNRIKILQVKILQIDPSLKNLTLNFNSVSAVSPCDMSLNMNHPFTLRYIHLSS